MTSTLFKLLQLPKYLLLLSLATTISCCNKDDDNPPTEPVDLLPAATQTGEGTFGCLVDGEVFLPGNVPNKLDCVYQYVDGGYYFALQGSRRKDGVNLDGIALGTNKLQIQEVSLSHSFSCLFLDSPKREKKPTWTVCS